MLLMALILTVMRLPPLAVLVQQSLILWLTGSSRAYCGTPLAVDALSQRRLSDVASLLDAVPFVLAHAALGGEDGTAPPPEPGASAGPWQGAELCGPAAAGPLLASPLLLPAHPPAVSPLALPCPC